MRPVLYEPREYTFTSNGLGRLTECLSCTVTEERNGIYELEMEYPINGKLYDNLVLFNIIVAKSNDTDDPQPFDIYNIEENGSTVKVYARHIAYRLAYMPCLNMSQVNKVSTAVNKLKACMAFRTSAYAQYYGRTYEYKYSGNYAFNIDSDGDDVTAAFYTETCHTAKDILNRIARTYKKDLKYDGFNIHLMHRGSDNGVVIRKGSNIESLVKERRADGAYNAVCNFYYQKGGSFILGTSSAIKADKLPYPRALIENVTGDYNQDSKPTFEQLDTRSTTALVSQTTYGQLSVDVDMAALWDSAEYEAYKKLIHVGLCDVVRVYRPDIDLDIKLTAEKVVYDVLAEKTKSVTLGSQGEDLSNTMAQTKADVSAQEENYLVNIFGGRACTAGSGTFSYVSGTRMQCDIDTGLSFVDNATCTLSGDSGTPWAQVTGIGIQRNVPENGKIRVTAAGSGFASGHRLFAFYQAVGTK